MASTNNRNLHNSCVLTSRHDELGFRASTVERVSFNKQLLVRSRLGDSVRWSNPPDAQTRKNRRPCEGTVGVGDCESSDRIRGCDAACSSLFTPSQELAARAKPMSQPFKTFPPFLLPLSSTAQRIHSLILSDAPVLFFDPCLLRGSRSRS